MERDELIALVSAVLAAANAQGDMPIITVCEELGNRLVAEGVPPVPKAVEVVAEAQCPACAVRRVKRTEMQRKWRGRKRAAK